MIYIEVNTDDIQDALERLRYFERDKTPLMRAMAGILADAPERAFAEQADPVTGEKWQPLSLVTIAQRAKIGRGPTPILQVSGQLAASIHSEYGPDFARVGTNKIYAGSQQHGAKKGQYGRMSILSTRREVPIPWGDIPARPFLGAGPQEEDAILQAVTNSIRKCVTKGV